MATEPGNPTISDEDLVAYLDGELDDAASRRIEETLVADPKVRQALQDLERTWDLLDELDDGGVDDRFTRSTLEMVAVAAAADLAKEQDAQRRKRWPGWMAGLAGALVAAAVGFAAVKLSWPDPDRRMAQDLPLLEQLDQYRQIDGFEFLKRLHEEHVFGEDAVAAAESPPGAVEPKDRRDQLAAMSPAQKADLLQASQRLEALAPAERERLRRLNRQIDEDPDGADLRLEARRYYEWLKTLPMYRRAEVVELPAEERIATIQKAIEEEEDRAVRQPAPRDADGLLAWMKDYARRHEAEVLALLPPDRRGELTSNAEHRARLVLSMLWLRWPSSRKGSLPVPGDSDLAEVLARVSPETRAALAARPPRDQWKLIASWARYLVHYQGDPHGGWLTPEASEAELLHFFEFELTPEQRDALLALPGDEMQRQLRRLYFRIKGPRPDFGPADRPEVRPWPPTGPGRKKARTSASGSGPGS